MGKSKTNRRKFSSAFKSKVALESARERSTTSELSQKYELHPTQISSWKSILVKNAPLLFDTKIEAKSDPDKQLEALYCSEIGVGRKIDLLDNTLELSMRNQCDLLSIPRGRIYYLPKGESQENIDLMSQIDRIVTAEPSFGILRIQDALREMSIQAGIGTLHTSLSIKAL